MVDEFNNAVQFDKMEICLSGSYQCDKYFQSLIYTLKEEQNSRVLNQIQIPSAKMNDITKKDDEICYYLSGKDSILFTFDKASRTIYPNQILDREQASDYELFVTASEYCDCEEALRYSEQCLFLNKTFDSNDLNQIKLNIQLEDVNDNKPMFSKSFYQVGITADIEFDESILEAYVIDMDTTGSLKLAINQASLVHNLNGLGQAETSELIKSNLFNTNYFPFTIKSAVVDENQMAPFKRLDFQIRTHKYLKKQDFRPVSRDHVSGMYFFLWHTLLFLSTSGRPICEFW